MQVVSSFIQKFKRFFTSNFILPFLRSHNESINSFHVFYDAKVGFICIINLPYETVLLNGAKTAKVVLQMLSARISYGLVSLTLFEGFFLLQSIIYSTNSS